VHGVFHLVICGGGIAALEGLLRIRSLMGDDVRVTLVAPNDHFVYRPYAIRQAVGAGHGRRYEMWSLTESTGAEWVKDSLMEVDAGARAVRTSAGRELRYDALLLAIGGRLTGDIEHALTFSDAEAYGISERVVADLEAGSGKSMAIVIPEGAVYPLPAYELALMTAARTRGAGAEEPALSLVTPEPYPLAVFGATAGAAVTGLLTQAGVTVYRSAIAYVPSPGRLLVQPQGAELSPDHVVAMPRVTGPAIPGVIGGGPFGFIPTDDRCTVPDTGGRVFAAGDATSFPVKHGGIGAQQADVAAAAIARLAGGGGADERFEPEIRGKLLTGGPPLYLRARLVGDQGFDSEVFTTPPWPVDDKVIAAELGPYLAGLDNR